MKTEDYNGGHGFENVMGVPKSFLPMYKDFSVTLSEHRIIKAANGRFNAALLQKLRKYKFGYTQDPIFDVLDYMSLETLFNYINKQTALGHYGPLSVISHLKDYYKMLDYFNVPINKSNRKPKDLKESHDKLVERYNAAIQAERDAASKKALEFVNAWYNGYQKDGFCIVVPKERADFIREGQILSHCVGGEHYYKNHISGTKMIFFIRQVENTEKPFYTAEIDMTSFQVLQCYGFGDKAAPKEIKDFIKSFARYAKQTIKTKGAFESANERKAS
ncbi:MAG: PcfJ domain-containing protein [Clostridia bacterium]|nr:PcfJ domain-containing protein [Clostridia bacterium]